MTSIRYPNYECLSHRDGHEQIQSAPKGLVQVEDLECGVCEECGMEECVCEIEYIGCPGEEEEEEEPRGTYADFVEEEEREREEKETRQWYNAWLEESQRERQELIRQTREHEEKIAKKAKEHEEEIKRETEKFFMILEHDRFTVYMTKVEGVVKRAMGFGFTPKGMYLDEDHEEAQEFIDNHIKTYIQEKRRKQEETEAKRREQMEREEKEKRKLEQEKKAREGKEWARRLEVAKQLEKDKKEREEKEKREEYLREKRMDELLGLTQVKQASTRVAPRVIEEQVKGCQVIIQDLVKEEDREEIVEEPSVILLSETKEILGKTEEEQKEVKAEVIKVVEEVKAIDRVHVSMITDGFQLVTKKKRKTVVPTPEPVIVTKIVEDEKGETRLARERNPNTLALWAVTGKPAQVTEKDVAMSFTKFCNSLMTGKHCPHRVCRYAHKDEQLAQKQCKYGLNCRHTKQHKCRTVWENVGEKVCDYFHPDEAMISFKARMGLKGMPKVTQLLKNPPVYVAPVVKPVVIEVAKPVEVRKVPTIEAPKGVIIPVVRGTVPTIMNPWKKIVITKTHVIEVGVPIKSRK